MEKLVNKFNGYEIKIIFRENDEIMFSTYDVANALNFINPRREVNEEVIKCNKYKQELVSWNQNQKVHFSDPTLIFKLAVKAEYSISIEFMTWVFETAIRIKQMYTYKTTNTNFYAITQIAKKYGISAKRLNQILHDKNIQYKVNDQWVLYHQYQDQGLTETLRYEKPEKPGEMVLHTYWTERGLNFIDKLMKELGYSGNHQVSIDELV